MRPWQRAPAGLGDALDLGLRIDLRTAPQHLVGGALIEAGREQRFATGAPGLLERGERGLEQREARRAEAADAVQRDPVWQIICSYVVHVTSLPADRKWACAAPRSGC